LIVGRISSVQEAVAGKVNLIVDDTTG